MSKLRSLKRGINKGKNKAGVKMQKAIKVKNGYLTLTFPLTQEQFKTLDLFTDYMMSFVYGDRDMDNKADAEEWAEKVKQYIDLLFGANSYYKCFGDDIATHKEIGMLFEQLSNVVSECRKEIRKNM